MIKNTAILLAAAIGLCGCNTTPDGSKSSVDWEAVSKAAAITCALTPTVAQIAAIYTDNPKVQKTEDVALLLCKAFVEIK